MIAVFRHGHRTEFVDDDLLAIETIATLAEDDGRPASAANADRHAEKHGRQQHDRCAGQDDIAQALGEPAHAVERRFAHANDRYAVHEVHARLDQIRDRDIRHEVDRDRRIVQRLQQLEDARLTRHGPRDVDELNIIAKDELRQPGHIADQRRIRIRVRLAIVEEGEHIDMQRALQFLPENSAELVVPDDHRAARGTLERACCSQHLLCAHLAQPQHGRSNRGPGEQHARLEAILHSGHGDERPDEAHHHEPMHRDVEQAAERRSPAPVVAKWRDIQQVGGSDECDHGDQEIRMLERLMRKP